MLATIVAKTAAIMATVGINAPSMATLIKVANMPPAGVKPPYMYDWKAEGGSYGSREMDGP